MPDNCKIIHNEPDWTPNNYDIQFDPSDIPSNIPSETANSLQVRLQKLMPLSKRIHINLSTSSMSEKNDFKIHSRLKINKKEVEFI